MSPSYLPYVVYEASIYQVSDTSRGSLKELSSIYCTCYIVQMINLHRCENTDKFSFFEHADAKVTNSCIQ